MRRRLAVPSLVLAAALALSACSPDGDGDTTSSGSPSASSEESPSVEVPEVDNVVAGSDVGFTASGAFGEKPTLEFTADEPTEGLQVQVVSEGDGAVVGPTDTVVAHYLGQIWDTETVFDNSYDRGEASSFPLTGVIAGWTTGLTGQKVGSRVLLSIPSALGYPEGRDDIKPGDTIVFVVDIEAAYGPDSAGQADATPTEADLPVTITGDLGAPVESVVLDEGVTPPAETVTTVVATGTGEPLADGETFYVQYTLTGYDGALTETTWGETGVGVQQVTLGAGSVFDPLAGTPRGSRVLLEIPADDEIGRPAAAVVVDVL